MSAEKALSMSDLKKSLNRTIEAVELDRETIVIVRHGRPVARLVPFEQPARQSVFGALRHRISVPDDSVDALSASIKDWGALHDENGDPYEA